MRMNKARRAEPGKAPTDSPARRKLQYFEQHCGELVAPAFAAPSGVRLCLCAPAERATLQRALETLADLLRQRPASRAGMGVV